MNAAAVAAQFCRDELGGGKAACGRVRDRHEDRSRKTKSERGGGSASAKRSHWKRALSVCEEKERVMESESAGREVDHCPVQVHWSGVFNLT